VTLRKVCPQCQTIVDKDSLFCEKCGANLRAIPVTEIRCCPNCGKLLDADALFCDGCGAKVETGSLASALTQPEVDSDKGRNTISEQVSVTDKTIVDHPSMPGPETVGTMQQPVAPVPVTVTQSTTSSVHAKLQKLGDYAPEVSGTDVTNYAILIITFITDFIIVSVFWFWVIGIFAPGPNADIYMNVATVLTLILPCILSKTSFMQEWAVWTNGGRSLLRAEAQTIYNAFSLVCQQAGLDPNNFNLYASDEQVYNAFSVGEKNIVVNMPYLAPNVPKEVLAGILAHEMGHLQHHDTRYSYYSYLMSVFPNFLLTIFRMIINLFGRISNFSVTTNWDGTRTISDAGAFCRIINWTLWLTYEIFHLIVEIPALLAQKFLSRRAEKAADKYACDIGLGRGLYAGLQQISQFERRLNFFERIFSDHPETMRRLQQISTYLATEEARDMRITNNNSQV
jgi:Zn-dependent protease with chaperone function/RNA polymerase subunit RPABC4/transcription elongation factor Spt4